MLKIKRGAAVALAVLALLLGASWSAHANTISFSPSSLSVGLAGGNFTLDLVGTGFTESTDGGAVSIAFDPAVVSIVSVSLDPIWDAFTALGTIDNGAGTITGIEFATFATPAASFLVGTITFAPVGSGTTSLTITEFTTGALGGFGVAGQFQTVTFESGSVSVAAIPEPATALLLAPALLALGGMRRRRFRRDRSR